jgi:LmbE family N-acetylglucosaminyl deacetylase
MKRTLLAVLAHPDDESFGIGGTLAKYAREGVDVHVAIATDGVAGSVVEQYAEDVDQLVAVRTKELEAAVRVLGGTLHTFCYRDSGYVGDPANDHPDAFVQVDKDEAVGRVVKLIREIRPQVVITHDETGGYYHPDHIQCWRITTPAFMAAGDSAQFPEIGPAPYQAQRLYYTALPRRWIKIFTLLMRLQGQNPSRMGRNGDIDTTRIGVAWHDIHAFIDYRPYWDVKREASSMHSSQGGGGGFSRLLPFWLQKMIFGYEPYMRAYPHVINGYREKDLFDGVE